MIGTSLLLIDNDKNSTCNTINTSSSILLIVAIIHTSYVCTYYAWCDTCYYTCCRKEF